MIGPRMVTLGDMDYELSEPQPDIFQLRELPDGPILGQYTRLPAHGRNKELFRIIGTDQQITSEKEIWYRLQIRYLRNQAQPADASPAPDTTGWLRAVEAAPAYGLTQTTLLAAIRDGSILAHRGDNGLWLVAPPQQPEPPAPTPQEQRIARAQAIFNEPDLTPSTPVSETPSPAVMAVAGPETAGWLTTDDLAARLGISRALASMWAKEGRVRAVKAPLHAGISVNARRGWQWLIDPVSIPTVPVPRVQQTPIPDSTSIPPGYIRTPEAAALYDVHTRTITKWARAGRIAAQRDRHGVWWVAPPADPSAASEPESALPILEPLAEMVPPAPPTNGNGNDHHAESGPVPVFQLPTLDTDLLTRLQQAEREIGRLQGENAYLRAQLADRPMAEPAHRRWWGR